MPERATSWDSWEQQPQSWQRPQADDQPPTWVAPATWDQPTSWERPSWDYPDASWDRPQPPSEPTVAGPPTETATSWAGFALPPDAPGAPGPGPQTQGPPTYGGPTPGPPTGPGRVAAYPPPPLPPPARSGPSALVIAAVVVLVVLLGAGATLLAVRPWSSAQAQDRVGPDEGGITTSTPAVPEPGPSTPPVAPPDPARLLATTAEADGQTYDATVGEGWWVPQLSSKTEGRMADGNTYDTDAIWRDHQALRERYGALLLNSNDYATFTGTGTYWVTVVPSQAWDSPEPVLGWCRQENLGSDDCYAKRVGHERYTEVTKLQR